jgi:hypothetical protein
MRTLYFGDDQPIRQHFPNLHPPADTKLATVLASYYRLSEAEQEGKFYLIFDYTPTLPVQAEARAATPPEIRERAVAVLEFDAAKERDQEIDAVRRSLWESGGGDSGDDRNGGDGGGVPVRSGPTPPARIGHNAKAWEPDASKERNTNRFHR